MKSIKKVFKWWWGWNSSKIENYLEEMAKKGWRLVEVSFGMTTFEFFKEDEQKTRYAFDYQNKIDDEYLTIIKDAGWKYVSKSSGWILWRKSYIDIRPNLFTDNQSLIDRNKRLIQILSMMILLQIPIITMSIIDNDYFNHPIVSRVIWFMYAPFFILLMFSIVSLFLASRRLKGDGRR